MIWILLASVLEPACASQEKKQDQQIKKWVEQLGSDEVRARESATRNLKAAGEAAIPYLKELAASRDLEVAFRAKQILAVITPPPPIVEAERQATEATLKILNEERVTYSFSDASVRSVLVILMKQTGVNLYLDPEVRGMVTLKVEELPAKAVLDDVVKELELSSVIYHGVVIVLAKKEGAERFKAEDLPGPGPKEMDLKKLKDPVKATARALLLGRKQAYSFSGANMRNVAEILGKSAGVRIVVDDALSTSKVSVLVAGLPLHVPLRLVCRQVGADWRIEDDGTVRIMKKK